MASAAHYGDIFSFVDFWSFGADDRDRGIAEISTILNDDLEILQNIFESNDYLFILVVEQVSKRLIYRIVSDLGFFVNMRN